MISFQFWGMKVCFDKKNGASAAAYRQFTQVCPLLSSKGQLRTQSRVFVPSCTHAGHLVGNWSQICKIFLFGVLHRAPVAQLAPFRLGQIDKTPGREFRAATAGIGIPSPPAPYRRFGRYRTEKATTCPVGSDHAAPKSPAHRKNAPLAKPATPIALQHWGRE